MIQIVQGDITTLAVDAIVNAANQVMHGRHGEADLLAACYRNSLAAENGCIINWRAESTNVVQGNQLVGESHRDFNPSGRKGPREAWHTRKHIEIGRFNSVLVTLYLLFPAAFPHPHGRPPYLGLVMLAIPILLAAIQWCWAARPHGFTQGCWGS